MHFLQLPEDDQVMVKDMVWYCIEHGYRMGMDEGIKTFAEPKHGTKEVKHDFRLRLEKFSGRGIEQVDKTQALLDEAEAFNKAQAALNKRMNAHFIPLADTLIKDGKKDELNALLQSIPACITRMTIAGKVAAAYPE